MKFTRGFDFLVPLLILMISSLGLASIWSLEPGLFTSQLFFITLGFFAFFIFSQIDFRIFGSMRWLIVAACILILVFTYLVGEISRGSVRWLQVGPFNIQPSEFVKPFLLIFLAFSLTNIKENKAKLLLLSVLMFLIPVFLVFKQPDLGSSLVLLVAFIGVVFGSEISRKIVLPGGALLISALPVSIFFLADYQRQRIISFLNPQSDPLGSGYHLIQATISAGSGELLGKGLGRGTQSQLAFLPERHTDFIFAAFSEELGFAGAFFVLVLYLLLLWRVLRVAQNTKHFSGKLFSLGVFAMLLFQIFVNIGMNLGMMPITGITLPFFSYGGSSVLTSMIVFGLIESVAQFQKDKTTMEIK